MKCYVLTISRNFPASHPRAGEPTRFEEKIRNGEKIHTIRGNYELWKKRFDQIDAGNAYLSVREWSGKPYASKQVELFRFDKSDGIGVQLISRLLILGIVNDIEEKGFSESQLVAKDGLSFEDFKNWFSKVPNTTMVIIHFTNFRY